MFTKPSPSKRLSTALQYYLALLFLAYCGIYLYACPSTTLCVAILAETGLLIASAIILKSDILTLPATVSNAIPQRLSRGLTVVTQLLHGGRAITLSIVALFGTCDFIALALAVCCCYTAAGSIYSNLPTTYWLGLHPAFSLEMLAGAFVNAGKYKQAEPLYEVLLSVRTSVCGPRSDLVGAMYADYGDLCVREHNLIAAEGWYRNSVGLGAKTGRAYTGLATVLRERGSYSESKECYLKALEIRKAVYGISSKQYNDTMRGYRHLQRLAAS